MNRSAHLGLVGFVMAIVLTACGRHVVIEPELVGTRNQADWIVTSAPAAVPAPAPSAPEAAPAMTGQILPPPPPAPQIP